MAKTDAETPANPYADWPTKQQVADETGVSVRTLERMIQQKQLQVAQRRISGRKPLVVISPADVERLKQESLEPQAFVMPEEKKRAGSKALTRATPPAALLDAISVLASQSATSVRLAERVFLSVPEAAAFTGLPKSYLYKQVRSGELKALKLGGWKIRRRDLEQL